MSREEVINVWLADMAKRTERCQCENFRKINVNMPEWMVAELDATARHLAVSRQAVINMWVAERLRAEREAVGA